MQQHINILFFGDVVGKPGRMALAACVPALRAQHSVDLAIANVENLAHGFGITPETIQELRDCGIDLFTGGNHIWKNPKGIEMLEAGDASIARPANVSDGRAGNRFILHEVAGTRVLLINLLGHEFMKDEVDSFFDTFNELYEAHGRDAITLVDLHAEATSEKRVFSWFADGKASVIVGTHTHVQTADEQILPQGTAFITDLGMSGAKDSSLGMDKDRALQKLTQPGSVHLEPPTHPTEGVVSGILVRIDTTTKQAIHIERIDQTIPLAYTTI